MDKVQRHLDIVPLPLLLVAMVGAHHRDRVKTETTPVISTYTSTKASRVASKRCSVKSNSNCAAGASIGICR